MENLTELEIDQLCLIMAKYMNSSKKLAKLEEKVEELKNSQAMIFVELDSIRKQENELVESISNRLGISFTSFSLDHFFDLHKEKINAQLDHLN